MLRPDGRSSGSTLRPFSCQLSCLSRADGSAQFSSGSTTVLAAVYGPAPPRVSSRERHNEAMIVVVFKHGNTKTRSSSKSIDTIAEREVERFIMDSLYACVKVDTYPSTVIEIVLHVVQADGSVLGTALNAAVLALMDAGVEMNSLPIGTTCLVVTSYSHQQVGTGVGQQNLERSSTNIILDPCGEEEDDEYDCKSFLSPLSVPETASTSSVVVVVVTDSINEGSIITSITLGPSHFFLDSYMGSVEAAFRASKAVVAFMRLAMEQKVTREAQTLFSK